MIEIRQLELDDFAAFLELGHIMHAECEPNVTFSDQLLLQRMFECIADDRRMALNAWIAWRNKTAIGMAVSSATNGWYTPELHASMHYWYVLPKYRKTRAAAELMRAYEKWSRRIGAFRMHIGAERFTPETAEVVNGMIAKRGFTKYGEQFYKEL